MVVALFAFIDVVPILLLLLCCCYYHRITRLRVFFMLIQMLCLCIRCCFIVSIDVVYVIGVVSVASSAVFIL